MRSICAFVLRSICCAVVHTVLFPHQQRGVCVQPKRAEQAWFSEHLAETHRGLLRAFGGVVTALVRSVELSWKLVVEAGEQCCESGCGWRTMVFSKGVQTPCYCCLTCLVCVSVWQIC